ncbi:vancomycin aglycone glucosyltransferase [Amycolatopsis pretoriensis]|uniref:Vancomycin aglycone glucosyltransferase n=1 Tax=Amycolatopsis pretoriensis TaxID=218821 RepID=A0A1H5QSF2_9PSEU|nr:glycosyltransferase [Amycolatopsis pretoriensis]SEF28764.1 vancomycin aglycone glucosyltransferase [Amycolatopsis pretoriensis]
MRVLLSTYGSRGDVEPLAAFAVRLKELGADVKVCAPPDEDFVRRLAAVDVPLVPIGPSARELTKAAPAPASLPERAAQLIAAQFDVMPAAAEDCDVLVATGMMPTAAGALSVAELVGIPAQYVAFQKLSLPSPHHAPLAYPGRPHPAGVTDNRALWDVDRESMNVLFGPGLNASRTAHGLPAVDDVRDLVVGKRPWLATDRVLDPWEPAAGLDVVQTGAWIVPDERPLPDDLAAFLADGEPPVYVGFGSMPMHAAADVAEVAVAAVRAHGRRLVLKRGWAGLTVDGDDVFLVDEVNHQALFPRMAAVVHHGGAGTTTTAARAGVPQVVVPQATDQPYWAGRVAALGAGVAHDGPVPTIESLTAALGTALAAKDRAAEVAALVSTDGTVAAAKLLLGSV